MQFLCFTKGTVNQVNENFNTQIKNLRTDIVKDMVSQMDNREVNRRLQRFNTLSEYQNWVYDATTSTYNHVNNDKLLTELEQINREYPKINVIQVPSVDVNRTLPEYTRPSTVVELIPEKTKPVWMLMDTFTEYLGDFGSFLCSSQYHYSFRRRRGFLLPVDKFDNVYTLSTEGVRVYNAWVALVNAGYFKFAKFNRLFDNLLPVENVNTPVDTTDDSDNISEYSFDDFEHFKIA